MKSCDSDVKLNAGVKVCQTINSPTPTIYVFFLRVWENEGWDLWLDRLKHPESWTFTIFVKQRRRLRRVRRGNKKWRETRNKSERECQWRWLPKSQVRSIEKLEFRECLSGILYMYILLCQDSYNVITNVQCNALYQYNRTFLFLTLKQHLFLPCTYLLFLHIKSLFITIHRSYFPP